MKIKGEFGDLGFKGWRWRTLICWLIRKGYKMVRDLMYKANLDKKVIIGYMIWYDGFIVIGF